MCVGGLVDILCFVLLGKSRIGGVDFLREKCLIALIACLADFSDVPRISFCEGTNFSRSLHLIIDRKKS